MSYTISKKGLDTTITIKNYSKLPPAYNTTTTETIADRLENARIKGIQERIDAFKCIIPENSQEIVKYLEKTTFITGKTNVKIPLKCGSDKMPGWLLYNKIHKLLSSNELSQEKIIELLTPHFTGINISFDEKFFIIFDWGKSVKTKKYFFF